MPVHDTTQIHHPIHATHKQPIKEHFVGSALQTSESKSKNPVKSTRHHITAPANIAKSSPKGSNNNDHNRDMNSQSNPTPSASIIPPVVMNAVSPFATLSPNTPIPSSGSQHSNGSNNTVPWLAPTLSILAALGVMAIAVFFFVLGRRKINTRRGTELRNKKHESWGSVSTIRTSVIEEGNNEKSFSHGFPPPAYYTATKQKRLTADTLVGDENEDTMYMLKKQYAPQLASSPTFGAGEFEKQEEELSPLRPVHYSLRLASSNSTLVHIPSSGDSQKSGLDSRPKRIEMYDPQVNLHNEAGEDPFRTPNSYSSNLKTRIEVNEEEKQKRDNNANVVHSIFSLNKNQY
ncbi:MAG: hypothetical protein EXX96DRAFT_580194 [Benjaminiella poitrasii]|nr:MAG: hypothetical protein EXX96DRAFT_580194 [Benjaminiella poitrasii]